MKKTILETQIFDDALELSEQEKKALLSAVLSQDLLEVENIEGDQASSILYFDNGIFVGKVNKFAHYHPELALQYLANTHDEQTTILYIPDRLQLAVPLVVQSLIPADAGGNVVVIVGAGARVTLYDTLFLSISLIPSVTRSMVYHVGTDAQVTVVSDQMLDESIDETTTETFYCSARSNVQYTMIVTGGKVVNRSLAMQLQGEHASATVRGLYALHQNQCVTLTTRQEHQAPDTVSSLAIKGALSGIAQAVYEGTIVVGLPATRSEATQHNKNILLSESARARSIPNLEVLTNDVHCAHGSAVGQLDADQLFYARSRGMTDNQAKRLLLQGFFTDVLTDIDNQDAVALVQARVLEKLVEVDDHV